MRKFACDICGVEVAQFEISTLHTDYCPDGIKDVCGDCLKHVTHAIRQVEVALQPIKYGWIKKIVLKLKCREEGGYQW